MNIKILLFVSSLIFCQFVAAKKTFHVNFCNDTSSVISYKIGKNDDNFDNISLDNFPLIGNIQPYECSGFWNSSDTRGFFDFGLNHAYVHFNLGGAFFSIVNKAAGKPAIICSEEKSFINSVSLTDHPILEDDNYLIIFSIAENGIVSFTNYNVASSEEFNLDCGLNRKRRF